MADIEQFREHHWVKGHEDKTCIEWPDVDCPTIGVDLRTETLLLFILIFPFCEARADSTNNYTQKLFMLAK